MRLLGNVTGPRSCNRRQVQVSKLARGRSRPGHIWRLWGTTLGTIVLRDQKCLRSVHANELQSPAVVPVRLTAWCCLLGDLPTRTDQVGDNRSAGLLLERHVLRDDAQLQQEDGLYLVLFPMEISCSMALCRGYWALPTTT